MTEGRGEGFILVDFDPVGLLLKHFPEYKDSDEYDPDDHDLPYVVWGNFGMSAAERMRHLLATKNDDDPFIGRVFDFANDMMDMEDSAIHDLVIIELFENFAQFEDVFELARRRIKPEHLTWLERQRL